MEASVMRSLQLARESCSVLRLGLDSYHRERIDALLDYVERFVCLPDTVDSTIMTADCDSTAVVKQLQNVLRVLNLVGMEHPKVQVQLVKLCQMLLGTGKVPVGHLVQVMPSMSDAEADSFIAYCFDRGDYGCLVMAATYYNRMGHTPYFKTYDVTEGLGDGFWRTLTDHLLSEERWSCFKLLLRKSSRHYPVLPVYQSLERVLTEEELKVCRMLLSRPLAHGWRVASFRHAIFFGQSQVCELIAFSENKNIREHYQSSPKNWLSVMVKSIWDAKRLKKDTSSFDRNPGLADFHGCLFVICESGLFRSGDSSPSNQEAMKDAVRYGQPDLVRYLYSVGVSTSRDLLSLASEIPRLECDLTDAAIRDRGIKPEEMKAGRQEIRDFFSQTALQPRSLQSLCVQEVSKHLGWGWEKKARVDQLPVAIVLKDALMLKDLRDLLRPTA